MIFDDEVMKKAVMARVMVLITTLFIAMVIGALDETFIIWAALNSIVAIIDFFGTLFSSFSQTIAKKQKLANWTGFGLMFSMSYPLCSLISSLQN